MTTSLSAGGQRRPYGSMSAPDTYRPGHPDHLKVFANPVAADEWFKENDPEGIAFEYEILGDENRPRSHCPTCGALIDMGDLSQILAHVHDT
jgi:hypothetical protein